MLSVSISMALSTQFKGYGTFAVAQQQMLRNPVAGSACGVPESEGSGVARDLVSVRKQARTH